MKFNKSISFGAGLLAVSSIGSYGFGLLRDRLLAGQFGASTELDIYSASFLIPDFIMNLFVAALTVAFVPVFSSWRKKQCENSAWELTNHLLYLITFIIVIAAVIIYFFTPFLTKLIAPGFNEISRATLINTSRLMLISPILFSLSIIFGSALQGLRRFTAYALSPILYNLAICLSLYFLAPKYGIYGAIIGVLIGVLIHFLIRLIESFWSGWRLKYFKPHWPGVIKVIKLMLPRSIALIAWQANLWIYTAIASGLAVGSIGIFNIARNFQSLPVSLFGIAFATSMFPALADHFADEKISEFRDDLSKTIRQVLFFTIPASMALVILARPIVNFFLGTGKFDEQAVITTGIVLSIFAMSIPFESLQHLLARGFYARHDTITPVKITIFASLINILISFIVAQFMGVIGLAFGFIGYAITQVLLLNIFLRKKIEKLNDKEILNSLYKIMIATLIMAVIIYLISNLYLAILIGGTVYLILAIILKMPELSGLKIIIKKIF
ncbi:MAG: murein biosynthesis integral membrane protein MurJ [Patescibacteria group bacterium]